MTRGFLHDAHSEKRSLYHLRTMKQADELRILFTSVGRRGYLLDWFREAMGGNGAVHAANSDPSAPGMMAADYRVVTPMIHDPAYLPTLLDYCRSHGIGAIIPLFDVDIPVLASARKLFLEVGTKLVCSESEVAAVCNDKWGTYSFLRDHGIPAAATWRTMEEAENALNSGEARFPLVVKPRWGMGSIGVFMAEDLNELRVFHAMCARAVRSTYLRYESAIEQEHAVLVQERLNGQEHGLDVVNDLNGKYITTFVKHKLAMRSGETDVAITVDSPELIGLGAKLGRLLGHYGNLDVDAFLMGDQVHVLEMNARFGGGYPFSHLAGADLPRAIVAWLREEEPDPRWLKITHGITSFKDIQPRLWSDT